MRAKSRIWCWLKVAAVLAVAECAGVPDVQAQSSGDVFRFDASYLRSGKYRENLFDPLRWEPQRQKGHRRSDSARTAPHVKAKSKPDRSESAATKKPDGTAVGTVEDVPLPRPRPAFWPEPHSFAEGAGAGFDSAAIAINDWRPSPLSSYCRGSSVRATAAVAI